MRGAPGPCLQISSEPHLCHCSIKYSNWQGSKGFLISGMKIYPSKRPETCALYSMVPFLTYAGETRQQIRPGTCVKHKNGTLSWLQEKEEKVKRWNLGHTQNSTFSWLWRRKITMNKALDHLPKGKVRVPGRTHHVFCSPRTMSFVLQVNLAQEPVARLHLLVESKGESGVSSGVLSWSPNCQLVKSQSQNRLVNVLLIVLLRIIL